MVEVITIVVTSMYIVLSGPNSVLYGQKYFGMKWER